MRVNQQPAFILHRYDYRETSLLLEVFSRNYGRVALVAKGARRRQKHQFANLALFQPMLLDWSSRSDMGTLCGADQDAELIWLDGQALLCGFYANELLMRLLQRQDPHEDLYDSYQSTIIALQSNTNHESTLRMFEKKLLQEIGYGLILEHNITDNSPIQPDTMYHYILDKGPSLRGASSDQMHAPVVIAGSSLLAFHQNRLDNDTVTRDAKRLTRAALSLHLEGRPLACRRLFQSPTAVTTPAEHGTTEPVL
ncbi:MAG: DNA repair protein RecO [Gammaproteobacteria bacterium]|nr:MAG: DNA repair protein RecO [Gammaproteobacteria bacterium]